VAGVCPYREAFGCTDADREDGVKLGKCVFELTAREELLESGLKDINVLREKDRPALEEAAHRFADATIYAQRGMRYLGIVSNQAAGGPGTYLTPEVMRAATRYVAAGVDRQLRTLTELQRVREEVHRRKHDISRILAEENRLRDEREPGWRRPKTLVIPDLAQS
jgi:hypothetical protein